MGLPRINGEIGKLWKDPSIRWTAAGKPVCDLPIVFNKRVKNRETEQWEDAGSMFVRGSVWDKTAENCANSLSKGDQIMVSGELSTREYDRDDGSKGFSVELRVWEVAVSLKWNEVKVLRPDRGSDHPAPAPEDDPWGSAPAAKSTADDEPPF